MRTVYDYLHRKVTIPIQPKRIISFVPAITETLFYLNVDEQIVGRTRFCIHPKNKIHRVTNVGGTKDFKLDRIRQLQPDLIIMEKEENTKEMASILAEEFPVYVFEVQHYEDVLQTILDLGVIVNREKESKNLHDKIQLSFLNIPSYFIDKRVAYVIWKNPYMVVGHSTYIQSILEKLGFLNPFIYFPSRYPEVTEEDIKAANLDYVLLASEPYPFQQKHIDEFLQINPQMNVILVDGEMFWYGPKMLEAVSYFQTKLKG